VKDQKSFSHGSKELEEEEEPSLLGSTSIIPKNTVEFSNKSLSREEDRKGEKLLINEDSRIMSHDLRESQDLGRESQE